MVGVVLVAGVVNSTLYELQVGHETGSRTDPTVPGKLDGVADATPDDGDDVLDTLAGHRSTGPDSVLELVKVGAAVQSDVGEHGLLARTQIGEGSFDGDLATDADQDVPVGIVVVGRDLRRRRDHVIGFSELIEQDDRSLSTVPATAIVLSPVVPVQSFEEVSQPIIVSSLIGHVGCLSVFEQVGEVGDNFLV